MVPWHFANGLCQELGIWQLQLMTVAYSTSAQGIFKCSLCNMLEIGNISLPLDHSEGSWSLVYVSIYGADGYLKLLNAEGKYSKGIAQKPDGDGGKTDAYQEFIYLFIGHCKNNQSKKTVLRQQKHTLYNWH